MTVTRSTVRKRSRQGGFTIVEFMVGSLVALVLIFSMGTMLFYGYRVYARSTAAVDLQRDATHAMEILTRRVQPGSSGTISIGTSEVQVLGTNGVTTRVYVDNQNLMYDPDTSVGGDELVLVDGSLVAFDVTEQFRHLQIHLELQGSSEKMEFDSRIAWRN